MKKQTKVFALIGAVVASAVALSGCAYLQLALKISAKADGNINLSTYRDSGIAGPLSGAIPAGSQITPGGSTGTAKIKLDASYDGGNWNVNGTYSDGAVRFKFKGYNLLDTFSNLRTKADSEVNPYTSTQKGGLCIPVISNYISTNSAMPGTGVVEFEVCDAPGSGSGSSPSWTDPDYIGVYVPYLGSGMDANPFANYLSGGTVAGYRGGSGATVRVTTPNSVPSYSPTPTWPSPGASPTNP
ncbi:MAG: hypothetical protein NTU50_07690 [Actinobacteria bacterium]|nr:hypothetical protein [Actinomycetota bacterium]